MYNIYLNNSFFRLSKYLIFLLDCVRSERGKAEGKKGIFPGMGFIGVFEAKFRHPRKNFEAESDLPRQNSVTLEKLPKQNSSLCYTLPRINA